MDNIHCTFIVGIFCLSELTTKRSLNFNVNVNNEYLILTVF